MTEKRKIEASRLGSVPFIALWTLAQIVAWIVTFVMWDFLDDVLDLPYQSFLEALLIVIPSAMIAAAGHVALVERGLKRSMRGWLPISLVGALLSTILYQTVITQNRFEQDTRLIILSIVVPTALLQMGWLWTRVKTAWLWGLAALISALLFILPIQSNAGSNNLYPYVMIAMAALLQGAVMGGTMLYLRQHERDKEKRAMADTDQQALERLSQAEQATETPFYAEQTAYQKQQR